MKKIIIITGLPGAGKDTVAEMLKKRGLPVFRFSDVIREELKKRGMPDTIQNEEYVAKELREKYGRGVIAERAADRVKDFRGNIIVLNGARSIEEIEYFSDFGEVIILVVEADEKERFARVRKRGDERDPKNIEEFRWRQKWNLEVLGVQGILDTDEYPKYTIPNDGTMKDLKQRVDSFCNRLMPGKGS